MRLGSEAFRLKSTHLAIFGFAIVGAFLLFYRPAPPKAPLGLLHLHPELGRMAPKFPDDEAQVAAILKACEAEETPPADLPLVRRIAALLAETEGGWFQFFYSETGAHAEETIADLRTIGAEKSAVILEEACKRFPKGKPHHDTVLRRRQLERLDNEALLSDLDVRFQLRDESLAELLRQHRATK